MKRWAGFSLMAVVCGALIHQSALAEERDWNAEYEALGALEKAMVDEACPPSVYPQNHMNCLEKAIGILRAADKPDMSSLEGADREAIEMTCANNLYMNADLYHRCLSGKMKDLARESYQVDLSALTPEEKTRVDQSCAQQKTYGGPGNYNACLRRAVAEIKGASTGRDELSRLDAAEKAKVREICEIVLFTNNPEDYSQCLMEEAAALKGEKVVEIGGQKVTVPAGMEVPASMTGQQPPSAPDESSRSGTATPGAKGKFSVSSSLPVVRPKSRDNTMKGSLDAVKSKPKAELRFEKVTFPPMPRAISSAKLEPDQLYAKVAPSVYVILAGSSVEDYKEKKNIMQGSAVAVSSDTLVTNCHVVKQRPYILVIQDRDVRPGFLLIKDNAGPNEDRCAVKVLKDKVIPIAGIRSHRDVKVGERVYAVGTPSGLERTLSEGLVSGLRHDPDNGHVIQTSAPISSGSSGGGLFDDRGNLIGVTAYGVTNSGQLNFAISAEEYWTDKAR